MKLRARLEGGALLLAWLAAVGCGDSGPGTAAQNSTCSSPSSSFTITDDTNYSLSNSFTIQMSTLKDATDLTFDWSRLARDFFGKPVDPLADIDVVLISLWHLTPAALSTALQNDNLSLSSNAGAITTYPDGSYTSQNLLGFNSLGNPLPVADLWKRFDTSNPNFQYPQDQYTFMAMASTGTILGKGARTLSLFNIAPGSNVTRLDLTNDSTKLDYSVHLTNAKAVKIPGALPGLTIDWGQMTVNALGNEYIPAQITQAVVAHFATSSRADLEAQFLNLESSADGWWSGKVLSGTSIDLGTLANANGGTFPGVDGNGIWLAALFCTESCNNPAPWSITFLESCK